MIPSPQTEPVLLTQRKIRPEVTGAAVVQQSTAALDPLRYRHRSDMATFAVQIDNHPSLIALLDIGYSQLRDLGPAKTASGKHSDNRAVPLAFQDVQIGDRRSCFDLLGAQPVPEPNTDPLRALDPANARRQLWAEQAGVSRLVCEPPDCRKPEVDCRRGQPTRLQLKPIPKHDCLVERDPRLGAVPRDEIVDCESIRSLRLRRPKSVQDGTLGEIQIWQSEDPFRGSASASCGSSTSGLLTRWSNRIRLPQSDGNAVLRAECTRCAQADTST